MEIKTVSEKYRDITDYFRGKRVLVAGGTGLIGRPLVAYLLEMGASVRIASLDDPSRANPKAEFVHSDLMHLQNCESVCEGMDYVFNLLCIKGSPGFMKKYPVTVLESILLFNTALMRSAFKKKAQGYLYTSSVAVYSPSPIFTEDAMWQTFPSPHDRFAAWAKRMGELQAEGYQIEHDWKVSVVRPANVYGPYDNFHGEGAMVIPSLIRKACADGNVLNVLGNGTARRDFIHTDDVALGMLLSAVRGQGQTINLGSGVGTSIHELVDIICSNLNLLPKIEWESNSTTGDQMRIMDISRAKQIGFEQTIGLQDGIRATMDWYRNFYR